MKKDITLTQKIVEAYVNYKQYESEYKSLVQEAKDSMKIGDSSNYGKYTVSLGERVEARLDANKVRKVIGDKQFMSIATVPVGVAKKVLTLEQLDSCTSEYKKIPVLEVKTIG